MVYRTSWMVRAEGECLGGALAPSVRDVMNVVSTWRTPCGGVLPASLYACGPSTAEMFKLYPHKPAGFAEMIGYALHFLPALRFCTGMFYIFPA